MDITKRIAANTIFLILGRVFGLLLQILIVAFLARYLGVSGYGKYAFVFAYLSFFHILCNLGINTILVREISRDKSLAPALIGHGILIRIFLSVISFSLAFLIITLLNYPLDTTKAVYVLSLILLFSAFQTPELIFQVYLKSQYSVLINLGNKLLISALIVFAISQQQTLIFIIWMFVISNLVLVVAIITFSRKFVKPKFTFNPKTLKWIARESWPVALSAIFITIYFKIDTIMLSLMKGDEAVGYYNAAYAIMSNLIFIPAAYAASIFPVISDYFKSSTDSLVKIFKRSFKYLSSLALPIVVGGVILSKRIIIFIYGEQFSPSIKAFQILIFAAGIIFISNLVSTNITAIHRQRINMWFGLVNVVLNISLNLLLIPRWSYIGASVATVATEGLGCSLAFLFTIKYFKIPVFSKSYLNFIKLLLAASVMALIVFYLQATHLIVLIPVAAICYTMALFLFGWFDRTDIDLFKQVLRLKK